MAHAAIAKLSTILQRHVNIARVNLRRLLAFGDGTVAHADPYIIAARKKQKNLKNRSHRGLSFLQNTVYLSKFYLLVDPGNVPSEMPDA